MTNSTLSREYYTEYDEDKFSFTLFPKLHMRHIKN